MVSRCFPGGYNVKLYISRGRLAWWLLAFLFCVNQRYMSRSDYDCNMIGMFETFQRSSCDIFANFDNFNAGVDILNM